MTFFMRALALLATCVTAFAAAPASSPETQKTTPADAPKFVVGQKIGVLIKEDPAYESTPEEVLVNPAGIAEFPVSRKSRVKIALEVAGKTPEEVSQMLKAKLDADYYVNATVQLTVTREQERPELGAIYVLGEGAHEQKIPVAAGEQMTILDVILKAGTTEYSNLKKVKLFRLNPKSGKVETRIIDVEEIKKTGKNDNNIMLQDGDRISVPEKGVVF